MGRQQVAGAMILERLRERIVSGLALGHWRPGDRLPSIREIAHLDGVDRKTAAAAYRRLQEEGLVRIRSRSGIYLAPPATPQEKSGPLERIQRHWLEHTYEGAHALGLDTAGILKILTAVAEIERGRVPVLECDWVQADAIARELRARLGIHAVPYLLHDLRPADPMFNEAAVLVTTPHHLTDAKLLAPGRLVVEATVAPAVVAEVRERAMRGPLVIAAGSVAAAEKLEGGVRHGHFGVAAAAAIRVIAASNPRELREAVRDARCVCLWPGMPDWGDAAVPTGVDRFRPDRWLADSCVLRLRRITLDVAIRRAQAAPAPEPGRPSRRVTATIRSRAPAGG